MPNTGAVSAGAGANGGNGMVAWTNAGNIASSNDAYAEAQTLSMPATQTRNLQATSFGFSLPAGATIDGALVEVEAHGAASGAHPSFHLVRLLKAGSAVGDNKGSGAALTATDSYYSFGGASDLWGTTLSKAEVENGGFGCEVQFTMQSDGETAESVYVDHIRMTVYYTESSGAARCAMTVVQATA